MFLSTFLSTACRVLPALVVELLMFASATVWAIQSYAPSWSGRIRGPVAASRYARGGELRSRPSPGSLIRCVLRNRKGPSCL